MFVISSTPVFMEKRALSAMYLHPAAFPGACDTQTLYLSMTTLKKLPFSRLQATLPAVSGCLGLVLNNHKALLPPTMANRPGL